MILDHLAVAGESLADAVAHVEDALGVRMGAGGQHARYGTHNRLIGLDDGLYLEAIAIDPDATPPTYSRWFDLDRFTGAARLANWICRTSNLQAALDGIAQDAGVPVKMERGDLRWLMAVPETGILPMQGAFPAVLQWQVPIPPGERLASSGCRLVHLDVAHPEASSLAASLGLQDTRVRFVAGAFALQATFDTPHGRRVLS